LGIVASSVGAVDAAPALLPHRAVYDLTLDRQSGSSGIATLKGRLVIELMGSACEGYTVNFRLVSQFADSDGRTTTSDLRSSTFEGGSGETFRFVTRNYVNDSLTEETDGVAQRKGEDVAVKLTKPADKTFQIEREVLFPTEHLNRVIAAAEKGEAIVQANVYDGSETGEKVYLTTAVIGHESRTPSSEDRPGLEGVTQWPVAISYFEQPEGGEQLPVYELSFRMYANGVSGNLVLDYGEFAVRGALSTLDVLSAAPCGQ
jgi:hypothetical protein